MRPPGILQSPYKAAYQNNLKSLAQVVFKILRSKRIGVTDSRDHSIAHMPFPIGGRLLWNQTSISNGFRDIQRQM